MDKAIEKEKDLKKIEESLQEKARHSKNKFLKKIVKQKESSIKTTLDKKKYQNIDYTHFLSIPLEFTKSLEKKIKILH